MTCTEALMTLVTFGPITFLAGFFAGYIYRDQLGRTRHGRH